MVDSLTESVDSLTEIGDLLTARVDELEIQVGLLIAALDSNVRKLERIEKRLSEITRSSGNTPVGDGVTLCPECADLELGVPRPIQGC